MTLTHAERALIARYREALTSEADTRRNGVSMRVVARSGRRLTLAFVERTPVVPDARELGGLLVWASDGLGKHRWCKVIPIVDGQHVVVVVPQREQPSVGTLADLRDSKLEDLLFRDWWSDDANARDAMLVRRRLLRDPVTVPTAHDAPRWIGVTPTQARAFDLARCSDAFLFGPPGSGKTRTLLAMMIAFLLQPGSQRRRARYFAMTRKGREHAEALAEELLNPAHTPRWLDVKRVAGVRKRIAFFADFDLAQAEARASELDEELIVIDDANQLTAPHALALRTAVDRSARGAHGSASSEWRLRCVWSGDRRGMRPIVHTSNPRHASVLKDSLLVNIERCAHAIALSHIERSPESISRVIIAMRAEHGEPAPTYLDFDLNAERPRHGHRRDDAFPTRTVSVGTDVTHAVRSSRCTKAVADLATSRIIEHADMAILCPDRSRRDKIRAALARDSRAPKIRGALEKRGVFEADATAAEMVSTIAKIMGAEVDDVIVDFTDLPAPVQDDPGALRALLVAAISRARRRCTVVIPSDKLAHPAIKQLRSL